MFGRELVQPLDDSLAAKLEQADVESIAYAEDPDAHGRGRKDPPFDAFMSARVLLCRHMRLAFEADADWLVETLEAEREAVAAQAAYTLALEIEARLRPGAGTEEAAKQG